MKSQGSRRNFLTNVVGAAAAAKLLPFMPREAFGATTTPKRLLCVFSPMGYLEDFFWPTGEGASFKLGETQAALEPFKDKLLYVNGLLHSAGAINDARHKRPDAKPDNEHGVGMTGIFTGSQQDPQGIGAMSESIDQTVAKHLYAQTPTPYKSIAVSVNGGAPGGHNSCFFLAPGQPVTNVSTVSQAFDTYFAKLQVGNGSGPTPAETAALARRKLLNQSVIDNVRAEFNAVCSRLGTQERKLCDAHLEGLRLVEKRVQMAAQGTPAQCSKPSQTNAAAYSEAEIRAQIDIIRSTFACDLTRVATLQLGMADGAIDIEGMPNQHTTAHNITDTPGPQAIANHKLWDKFYAKQWLYLLEQLSSVPEGNGTMLDNTLVLFGSETTTGQSIYTGAHCGHRFPMWIAGGSGFAFRTGRQVTLPLMHWDTPSSASNAWGHNYKDGKFFYHNALLVSVAQAFGLETNKFGNLDQGVGGIPGLK